MAIACNCIAAPWMTFARPSFQLQELGKVQGFKLLKWSEFMIFIDLVKWNIDFRHFESSIYISILIHASCVKDGMIWNGKRWTRCWAVGQCNSPNGGKLVINHSILGFWKQPVFRLPIITLIYWCSMCSSSPEAGNNVPAVAFLGWPLLPFLPRPQSKILTYVPWRHGQMPWRGSLTGSRCSCHSSHGVINGSKMLQIIIDWLYIA